MAVTNVHEAYLPQSTRDNYAALARETAERNGTAPKVEMQNLAKTFATNHKNDPTAGWEHLAAWAKDFDPTEGSGLDAANFALSRAVETARRDPTSVLQAHSAVVETGIAALKGEDGSPAVSANTQG